jgi:hypothetical protein
MRRFLAAPARLIVTGFTGLMTSRRNARRAVAVGIATAILNLSATVAFASPGPGSSIFTGMIDVGGVVTINGLPAISGQTLFSGSSIVTAQRSESTLDLGNLTRLQLDAETDLTLEFSRSGLSASLENGSLHGFIPVGVRADIITADASVATDARQPAAFSIQVDSCTTTISVQTGRVEIRTGNKMRSVTAGQSFSTAYGSLIPPAPQQNPGNHKRVGLFAGIGAAIAVLLVAITGRDAKPGGGCPLGLSNGTGGAISLSSRTGSATALSDVTGSGLCP